MDQRSDPQHHLLIQCYAKVSFNASNATHSGVANAVHMGGHKNGGFASAVLFWPPYFTCRPPPQPYPLPLPSPAPVSSPPSHLPPPTPKQTHRSRRPPSAKRYSRWASQGALPATLQWPCPPVWRSWGRSAPTPAALFVHASLACSSCAAGDASSTATALFTARLARFPCSCCPEMNA
jgi:hypothetical protein